MNRWLTLVERARRDHAAVGRSGVRPAAQAADCKAATPDKVEGQVLRVDHEEQPVTMRDKSGITHEFQANAETTKDLKAGDTIEARLREAPKC